MIMSKRVISPIISLAAASIDALPKVLVIVRRVDNPGTGIRLHWVQRSSL
jgi:hypothetical protein